MVDLIGEAGSLVGIGGDSAQATASSGGGMSGFTIILIVIAVIIFATIIGWLTYMLIMKIQYKYKVRIWERVNGRFQPTRNDTAKKIKVGEAGDQAFLLRKAKKMLPMPSLQAGINNYWFFISDDGEWINFDPGDFDEQRREMKAHFLDKEMRYARTSLQYMAKERYDKAGFWEKYGGIVAYAILILVTCIGFYLIVNKLVSVANATTGAVETARQVLEEARRLLGAIDSIRSGGSGIIPTNVS